MLIHAQTAVGIELNLISTWCVRNHLAVDKDCTPCQTIMHEKCTYGENTHHDAKTFINIRHKIHIQILSCLHHLLPHDLQKKGLEQCESLLDFQTKGCVASLPSPCTFPPRCCATSPLDNHKRLASSRCHACQAPLRAVHREGQ